VELLKDSVIYSRPEKIQIPMTTDAIFSKINVLIRANNAKQAQNIVFQNVTGEADNLGIDIVDIFGTDIAIFPLHFEGMKMFIDAQTEKGERYVTLPGIIEVFGEDIETAVENVALQEAKNKYIENGALYIHTNNATYNVLGAQVK
jgi:hypothetical protein